MADAPSIRQLALSGRSVERRAINHEYSNELLVANTDVIRTQQVQQMQMQVAASTLTLRAMSEIAARQDSANDALHGMAGDLGLLQIGRAHV